MLLLYLMQSVSSVGSYSNVDINEVLCLAENIYHEARGESLVGKRAVAAVTINRQQLPQYPNTICGVVNQANVKNGIRSCAFSWVCARRTVNLNSAPGRENEQVIKSFTQSAQVAIEAISGTFSDPTNGATHFHSVKIPKPSWALPSKYRVNIGNHIFYKLHN